MQSHQTSCSDYASIVSHGLNTQVYPSFIVNATNTFVSSCGGDLIDLPVLGLPTSLEAARSNVEIFFGGIRYVPTLCKLLNC